MKSYGNEKGIEDEGKQEELSLFLAQNKEEVLYALGAKRKPAPKAAKKAPAKETADDQADAA